MSDLITNLNNIKNQKDSYIIPNNIKKDVTVLNVTGVYEGTQINNQDKTITQNGSYTADNGYTGLGAVVVDVDTGIDTSDATANANDIINPKTAYVDGQKVIGSIIPTEVELSPTITYNVNSSINAIKPSAFRDDLIVRRDGSTLLIYQMVNNTITTLITSTDFFSNTYELGKVLQLSEAFVAQNGTDKEYLLGYTEGPQPPADTAIKYQSQYNDFLKFARINYTNGVWTITKMESSFTPLASGFMSFKFVQDSQNKNLLHFVITGGRYYNNNSCQYLIQFYNATYTVGENIVFGNNLSYEIVYGGNSTWAWTATMRIDLAETTTGHWDALVFMCQFGTARYLPNHSWSGGTVDYSTYIRFGLSDNFSTRVYTVTDRTRTSQNVLSTPQEILLSNGYLIKVDATTSNSNLTLNLYKPNTTTGALGSALNTLTIPSPYYNQYYLNISLRDMDNAIVIIANYYRDNTSTSPTGKYRVVYIDNEQLVAGPTTFNTLTGITLDADYVIRGSGSNGDNLVLISSTNGLHIVKKEKNIKIVALDRDDDIYYNTYDATAKSLNILSGRIAYGVNGKITGTMPNNGTLNITPSTSQQTIPAGYTSGGTVSAVDNTIDNNISPENIKHGVEILGVTGNYIGGEDLENVIAEQENIIANLSNIVNTKAGTLYHVQDGTKFMRSTFSTISNLDTSDVTDMSNMFNNCFNLTTVPNFNTSNVTTMRDMFGYCHNLTSIPEFDTSKVTTMGTMFWSCTNLTSVPEFDTSNVTTMAVMFWGCNNLTSVPNFNTTNVIEMDAVFSGCTNLTSIPNFNTAKVTTMANMFYNCINLTDVPEFDTTNVTDMRNMFKSCNNLSTESIQNIINMCLNSNITSTTYKNLKVGNSYSPFYSTNITNSRYSNRLEELTAAGWKY